ncbi:MAG: metallophosphoesterase family protein [Geminicoccaceae bacterium]
MTVFFTADTHFGHGGALGLFMRPFPSVAAMDEAMVRGWNERVGDTDEVWHLGDVAMGRTVSLLPDLLRELRGRKHLVAGNNDGPATRGLSAWSSVQDYAELTLADRFLVLCHYPLRAWNRQHRGALQLHGHSHGRLAPLPRQVDVGVDVWNFAPVALDELLERSVQRSRSRVNSSSGRRTPRSA